MFARLKRQIEEEGTRFCLLCGGGEMVDLGMRGIAVQWHAEIATNWRVTEK